MNHYYIVIIYVNEIPYFLNTMEYPHFRGLIDHAEEFESEVIANDARRKLCRNVHIHAEIKTKDEFLKGRKQKN